MLGVFKNKIFLYFPSVRSFEMCLARLPHSKRSYTKQCIHSPPPLYTLLPTLPALTLGPANPFNWSGKEQC